MLGHEVTKAYGGQGLPDGTIDITFDGSAGNSFGAFVPKGITLRVYGDANDYVGKGLSGGRLVVRPSDDAPADYVAEDNIIARQRDPVRRHQRPGVPARRQVGERFAVRNSGAHAVVEGVGDHGCEYMTGGKVVILGPTGRNFAAGMSGGVAYVYDPHGVLPDNLNAEMVELEALDDDRRRRGCATCSSRTSTPPIRPWANGSWPTGMVRTEALRQGDAARLQAGARRRSPRPNATGEDVDTRSWRPPVADPRGFLKITHRETPQRRPVPLRLRDWNEVYEDFSHDVLQDQAGRCMDCGIPFCHNGCPLGNLIPEWNDLVYRDRWRDAIERLHATNNFPEFTGRLCPAPCEASCVLGINQDPVTIKQVEVEIIDNAFDEGWVVPLPPDRLTGKKVAVVGSGPGGPGRRAAADPGRPRR